MIQRYLAVGLSMFVLMSSVVFAQDEDIQSMVDYKVQKMQKELALTDADLWAPVYIKWEMNLLQSLGYGMDLSQCAGGGNADNLVYVSPRTGRAVSREVGQPYHDKLFPLPAFLIGGGAWDAADIVMGLELTGHFLSRHIFINPHSRLLIPQDGDLPLARQRLIDYYRTQSAKDQAAAVA